MLERQYRIWYHLWEAENVIETKRLQRLFDRVRNIRKNRDFADVRRLLVAIGFEERRGRGSHAVFRLERWWLVVPRHNPVGFQYMDDVIDAVKEILQRGKERKEEDR